jgi:hypothetical protein
MTQLSRASLADARQPFKRKDYAELVAKLAERMTGERHEVVTATWGYYYILRYTHGGWKCGRG